jgi:hypothetical protein
MNLKVSISSCKKFLFGAIGTINFSIEELLLAKLSKLLIDIEGKERYIIDRIMQRNKLYGKRSHKAVIPSDINTGQFELIFKEKYNTYRWTTYISD